jgi:hypothetical protein
MTAILDTASVAMIRALSQAAIPRQGPNYECGMGRDREAAYALGSRSRRRRDAAGGDQVSQNNTRCATSVFTGCSVGAFGRTAWAVHLGREQPSAGGRDDKRAAASWRRSHHAQGSTPLRSMRCEYARFSIRVRRLSDCLRDESGQLRHCDLAPTYCGACLGPQIRLLCHAKYTSPLTPRPSCISGLGDDGS